MYEQFTPLLEKMELICPIPEIEKQRFLAILKARRLGKGDFFVRAGEKNGLVGFMVSGLLRYFYVSENGKEFIKHFCLGGNFIATLSSLLTNEMSSYFIEALEETNIIVFSYQDWLKLLKTHPVWGQINGEIQNQALITAEKRERSLILDDAMTRYRELLADFPGIEGRVKLYDIANYLGITAVALSRLRGKTAQK